jgi:hypothetical protein
VFAGDTAQTITAGVGFRFTDVKSMLTQHIEKEARRGGRREGAAAAVGPPLQLSLCTNYRTHAGVRADGWARAGTSLRLYPGVCGCCTISTWQGRRLNKSVHHLLGRPSSTSCCLPFMRFHLYQRLSRTLMRSSD